MPVDGGATVTLVDNRGDAGRIVMAHRTCNQLLAADLRTQEQYRDWVIAQDVHRRIGPPAWVRSMADAVRCMDAIQSDGVPGVPRDGRLDRATVAAGVSGAAGWALDRLAGAAAHCQRLVVKTKRKQEGR